MCRRGSIARCRDRRGKRDSIFRRATSAPSFHRWMMDSFHGWMIEALAKQRNEAVFPDERFDYWALAPVAGPLCYPFLLRAFHAVVGPASAAPSPLAILGAILILTLALGVPFLGIA